jgi:hypothetical protein
VQVIAKDSSLVMDLVNHLLQVLNYGLLYDEKGQGKEKKYTPKPLVLSATAALGEAMQTDEMAGVVEEHYALIFGSLLLRMGTSQDQPEALKVITEATKSFLECAKEETLQDTVKSKDLWSRLNGAKYTDVITEITAVVGKEHPEHVGPLYRFLLPFMKGNYPGHRVVAACTLAEVRALACITPASPLRHRSRDVFISPSVRPCNGVPRAHSWSTTRQATESCCISW